MNIAEADESARCALPGSSLRQEFGVPFAVRHRDGQNGAGHALQHHGRGLEYLNQCEPRFVLLAAVGDETWPMLRAGNEALQGCKHLAAVAETERETVSPLEEASEVLAHLLVEKDRLGPPLTGSQHIAIRETTAGDEAFEFTQRPAPRQQVRHVHIVCHKAGALEDGRRFNLTIDPLLAQNRNSRAGPARYIRRGNV